MTPREFQVAARALSKEIGTQAEIFATVSLGAHKAPPLYGHIYVNGMGHGVSFSEDAETFDELLQKLTTKWAEHKDEHEKQFVRKLALRIIEITAALGECTDAALRGRDFSTEDVIRYGERACAEANDIAGKGPFKLRMLGRSNRAPAEAEA